MNVLVCFGRWARWLRSRVLLSTFLVGLSFVGVFAETPFITKWKGDGQPISFSIEGKSLKVEITDQTAETKNYEIGKPVKFNTSSNKTYEVKITGQIDKIQISNQGTPKKLISIEQWGSSKFKDLGSAFWGCENLTISKNIKDVPDLSACRDLTHAFRDCKSLVEIDPANKGWNVQSVESMAYAFTNCYKLNDQAFSKWKPTSVRSFAHMFDNCESLGKNNNALLDLKEWSPKRAVDLSFMFKNCFNLKLTGIDNWDVSNCFDFAYMFQGCRNLNFNPANWNVSKAVNLTSMFYDCRLDTEDFTNWAPKLKNVKSFENMFRLNVLFQGKGLDQWFQKEYNYRATNIAGLLSDVTASNPDVSKWDVSKIKDMRSLFNNCKAFTGKGLDNWDVSKCEDMSYMFRGIGTKGTSSLPNATLEKWDVSNVRNMEYMFYEANNPSVKLEHWKPYQCVNYKKMFASNQTMNYNLSNWVVVRGEIFDRMFENCTAFNADLSSWRLNAATSTIYMFANCPQFNRDLSNWGMENVVDAEGMFYRASLFNKNIGQWKFKNLQNMKAMFQEAKSFQQDISRWNVANVLDMSKAFYKATSFKGTNLGKWNVGECTNFSAMFQGANAFEADLSDWDMHSAEDISYMFAATYDRENKLEGVPSTSETYFGKWNVKSVQNMEGLFLGVTSDISGVEKWKPIQCLNFTDTFRDAKGFKHSLEEWEYATSTSQLKFTLANCGMGLAAYDRTIKKWAENGFANKFLVEANELYYSNKTGHDACTNKGFLFTADSYVNKNLAFAKNTVKIKVDATKNLPALTPPTGATISITPKMKGKITLLESNKKVKGVGVGRARVEAKSNQAVDYLHDYCDIEVYKAINKLVFSKTELELGINEELNLWSLFKVEPKDATYPKSIEFKIKESKPLTGTDPVLSLDDNTAIVKGLAEGTVKITISTTDGEGDETHSKITQIVTIKVIPIAAKNIRMIPQVVYLGLDTKIRIQTVFTPKNTTDKKITYTIKGNQDIVSLNQKTIDGVTSATLTGKTYGDCKLVAQSSNGLTDEIPVHVTKTYVKLTGLEFTEPSYRLPRGTERTLPVKYIPATASNKSVIWGSQDPDIVHVDEDGIIRCLKVGKTQISMQSVENQALVVFCEIEVYEKEAEEIEFGFDATKEIIVGKGRYAQINFTIKPDDASNKGVKCTSSKPQFVEVDEATGKVFGKEIGESEITIEALGGNGLKKTCKVKCVLQIDTQSIAFKPNELSCYPDEEIDITSYLKFTPEGATDRDVTWFSTNTSAVTVENGKIKAIAPGTATIRVTLNSDPKKVATCKITVKEHTKVEELKLLPQNITLGVGDQYMLNLFTTPDFVSKLDIKWTLNGQDNCEELEFDVTTRVVTAKKPGSVTVKVELLSDPDINATCVINIKAEKVATNNIAFKSTEYTLDFGTEKNMNDELNYDPTTATDRWLDWTSSDPDKVVVRGGYIRCLAATTNPVTITAKLHSKSSVTAECKITVRPPVDPTAIRLSKNNLRIRLTDMPTLTVSFEPEGTSDKRLVWKTSADKILKVDNNGKLMPQGLGKASVTVSLRSKPGIADVCHVEIVPETGFTNSITFKPNQLELFTGDKKNLNDILTFDPESTTDKELIWSTTNDDVVTVVDGNIVAVAPGKAKVTAVLKSDSDKYDVCHIVVKAPLEVTILKLRPEALTLGVGDSYPLVVFTKPEKNAPYELRWSVNGIDVAGNEYIDFDPATQLITAKKATEGSPLVLKAELTTNPDVSATCTITIKPESVATTELSFKDPEYTIPYNGEFDLNEKLNFTPETATNRWLDWQSEDPNTVSVRGGYIRGLAATSEGVRITATLHTNPSVTASCIVKVTDPVSTLSIALNTKKLKLKKGAKSFLSVIFTPSNATDREVSWESSNNTIVKVDAEGNVTALDAGEAWITVTLLSDKTKQAICHVEVVEDEDPNDPFVQDISIKDIEVQVGQTLPLVVTYDPTTAKEQSLIFEDYDYTKCYFVGNNVVGKEVTDEAISVTARLANNPTVHTNFKVKVVAKKPLVSFTINQESIILYEHNDGVLRVVTDPVDLDISGLTWDTEDASVCTINAEGIVHAVAEGTTSVVATLDGQTQKCEVKVLKVGQIDTPVDDAALANVLVAPNPFNHMLRISGYEGEGVYTLVSVTGQLALRGLLQATETLVETANLPAGVYLLRLETGKALKTVKVVKQ